MLFIVFQIGPGRYAIDAKRVAEVLPLMPVRPAPQSPPEVAGLLSYRGAPLPVIDLSRVVLGLPSPERLNTRILVVNLADGRQVGLIAERANETLQRNPGDFVATGIAGAECLGPVTEDARGFVQRFEPDQLLKGSVYPALLEGAA